MINARLFSDDRHKDTYRQNMFNTIYGEEGGPEDRPLVVQVSGPTGRLAFS